MLNLVDPLVSVYDVLTELPVRCCLFLFRFVFSFFSGSLLRCSWSFSALFLVTVSQVFPSIFILVGRLLMCCERFIWRHPVFRPTPSIVIDDLLVELLEQYAPLFSGNDVTEITHTRGTEQSSIAKLVLVALFRSNSFLRPLDPPCAVKVLHGDM